MATLAALAAWSGCRDFRIDPLPTGAGGTGGGSGGATAGSGGATAGSGGATAGSGGATAGSGGATAGSGGATAGSGGTIAGSGGATAGSGGATGAGGSRTDGGNGGASGGSNDAATSGLDATSEPPPLPAPFAFYPFNQTAGTVASDASGNGHDGTIVGNVTFGTGMVGMDLHLAGASQYVSLPAGLLAGVTDVTIAAWVRPSLDQVWSQIFSFGTGTNVYMFLTMHNGNTNTVRFAITIGGNTSEQQLNGPNLLPVNVWTHVAVVLGPGSTGGTLYVNGEPVATNAALTLRPMSLGSTTNNWFGRSQFAPDPYFAGDIDELRIYSQALSAAEIMSIFMLR